MTAVAAGRISAKVSPCGRPGYARRGDLASADVALYLVNETETLSEGEFAMSEMERQVRGFWARIMEWLRGPRGAEAAQRARNALDDVRTSDVGRKAESA